MLVTAILATLVALAALVLLVAAYWPQGGSRAARVAWQAHQHGPVSYAAQRATWAATTVNLRK